jgi:hypothetical protein
MAKGLCRKLLVAAALATAGSALAQSNSLTLRDAALVRKAVSNGQVVDQLIPNDEFNPYALLTFNQIIHDDLNAFSLSDSSFVIPPGISFAEFRATIVWGQNPTGLRQCVIQRKSALNVNPDAYEFFTGDPVHTQVANADTTTDMECGTAGLIPVQPGERYAVFPFRIRAVFWQFRVVQGPCSP